MEQRSALHVHEAPVQLHSQFSLLIQPINWQPANMGPKPKDLQESNLCLQQSSLAAPLRVIDGSGTCILKKEDIGH